jgi:hypothetical protein
VRPRLWQTRATVRHRPLLVACLVVLLVALLAAGWGAVAATLGEPPAVAGAVPSPEQVPAIASSRPLPATIAPAASRGPPCQLFPASEAIEEEEVWRGEDGSGRLRST